MSKPAEPLDVTGYGGLTDTPTLQLSPLTDTIAIEVERRRDEIGLAVETVAPGEVPVRSNGTLTLGEARELRDELDEAIATADS